MINVNMKTLIEKCNTYCMQALNSAAGIAVNRGHYEVSFEHFLLACLDTASSDIPLALSDANAELPRLKADINKSLEEFQAGNSGRPVFSPTLQEILEAAWLISSVDLQINCIRSGSILLAFLRRPSLYAQGTYTSELVKVKKDTLLDNFFNITHTSIEEGSLLEKQSGSTSNSDAALNAKGGESFLAKFCEDFTQKARDGKIDPVFGRDKEIRQMIDILARRRKNNPILVGEPGVGKTAVMEGLALRITLGEVPDTLQNVTLLELDMGLLEAGASMKGEFERRLKGVLDEIKSSIKPIVLFIDEAHLLVGAGNNAGGSDAANLMKPALARGEIRTCAATTWKEYKKYFEKDPALARRFQLVALDEPSIETTALILRGLRSSYEKAHNVLVQDASLQAAAEFSSRYITGRFLPDKAVDLLDTACARVKVNLVAKPASLEDTEQSIKAFDRQIKGIERDILNGNTEQEETLPELREKQENLKKEAVKLEQEWQEELTLARDCIEARTALHALTPEQAEHEAEYESKKAEALKNFQEKYSLLKEKQGKNPLVYIEVTTDTIAKVVSDWTGIPVGKMAREQAGLVSDLQSHLENRIKGQSNAIKSVVQTIQASKAGLRSPSQPMGVLLLVGPSGVGKTETGLSLADILFGDEKAVITINMSEFQEKHTVSRLIGSPPGYVGYGEGGMLTEAVRRKPYSVVLLDEVEKAHTDIMQLFYQVFDKGTLTDGEGTEVSFKNTIIMLTSNLASETIQKMTLENPDIDSESVIAAIRPVLSKHFQPALLARMSVVPYAGLNQEALHRITLLKLQSLADRIYTNNKMRLTWTEQVPESIAARCTEVETGARNIDYILSASVMPRLAERILAEMAANTLPQQVILDVDKSGEISIEFN